MGKRVRLKRGDIYRFDLDYERYGLGQIIDPGVVFYTTILRTPVSHDFVLSQVDTRDILLCGRTTDALFFHQRWLVIGNLPVPADVIPQPCSKVEADGQRWISDFTGSLVRLATDREWTLLDYQSSNSPIAYQNALLAHHGLAAVAPHYEELGIEHVRAQAAICSA